MWRNVAGVRFGGGKGGARFVGFGLKSMSPGVGGGGEGRNSAFCKGDVCGDSFLSLEFVIAVFVVDGEDVVFEGVAVGECFEPVDGLVFVFVEADEVGPAIKFSGEGFGGFLVGGEFGGGEFEVSAGGVEKSLPFVADVVGLDWTSGEIGDVGRRLAGDGSGVEGNGGGGECYEEEGCGKDLDARGHVVSLF